MITLTVSCFILGPEALTVIMRYALAVFGLGSVPWAFLMGESGRVTDIGQLSQGLPVPRIPFWWRYTPISEERLEQLQQAQVNSVLDPAPQHVPA